MKQVVIVMDKDGRLVADFSGFVGDQCLNEASDINKALSGLGIEMTVQDVERKPTIPELVENQLPQSQKILER